MLLQPAPRGLAIHADAGEHFVSDPLPRPRQRHSRANRFARFLLGHLTERRERHGTDADVEIHAIHQWAREPRAIAMDFCGRTATASRRFAIVAARAGIRGAPHHEARRKYHRLRRAHDRDARILERLSHGVEHVARELKEFIEEEDATMRERDFTGTWAGSATD